MKCLEENEFTFGKLMDEYEIQIPLIQREYAQGRENQEGEEVRKHFIPELLSILNGQKDELELNFIFGTVIDNKTVTDNKIFIPLDGQQRLTTLLLLYWYFGKTNKDWKFHYTSRRMADSFITNLLKNPFSDNYQDKPSDWILEQKWFFENWRTDPTVSGILTMLDAIDKKKSDLDSVDNKNLENISFYLYPIEKLDADNAYTKMNARGEPLTEWENIKALLDKKSNKFCFLGNINVDFCQFNVCQLAQWTRNIGGKWLLCLEKYWLPDGELPLSDDPPTGSKETSLVSAIKNINTAFRNIIDLAVTINLVEQYLSCKSIELLEKIAKFHEHQAMISDYAECVKTETYLLISEFFNCLILSEDKLKKGWTAEREKNCFWVENAPDGKAFLNDFLFHTSYSYSTCARFYAFSRYTINDKMYTLTRILNLLDNTDEFNKEKFVSIIQGIDSLFKQYTEESLKKLSDFNRKQVDEEILKLKDKRDEFMKIEAQPLLEGSIGFLWDKTEEKFQSDWIAVFRDNLTENSTVWKCDGFFMLLEYFPEDLTEAIYVPGDNCKLWKKLLKQDIVRKAFSDLANKLKKTNAPWVTFFIENNKKMNNKKIGSYGKNIYDYRGNSKISRYAIRLNYKDNEKRLLDYCGETYLHYGQEEIEIKKKDNKPEGHKEERCWIKINNELNDGQNVIKVYDGQENEIGECRNPLNS